MVSKRIAGFLLLLVACAALVSAPFVAVAQSPTPPPDALDIVVLVDDTGSMKGGSNSDNKQFPNRDPQEIRFDIANNLPQALKESSLPDERIRILGIKFTTDRLPSPAINLELQPVNTISNGLKIEYFAGDFEPVFQLALKALQCDSQTKHIGKAIVLLSDGYPQEEDNAKLLPSDALLTELKKCGVHVSFVRFTDSEFPDTKFEAQWKRVMSQISQNPSVQVQIFPVTRNMRKTDLETKAIPKKIVNQIEKSLSWNKAAGTNEAKQGGVVNTPLPTTTFVESTKSPVPTLTDLMPTSKPSVEVITTSAVEIIPTSAPKPLAGENSGNNYVFWTMLIGLGLIFIIWLLAKQPPYRHEEKIISKALYGLVQSNDPEQISKGILNVENQVRNFNASRDNKIQKILETEYGKLYPVLRKNYPLYLSTLKEQISTIDISKNANLVKPLVHAFLKGENLEYRGDQKIIEELYCELMPGISKEKNTDLQKNFFDAPFLAVLAQEDMWKGIDSAKIRLFCNQLNLTLNSPSPDNITLLYDRVLKFNVKTIHFLYRLLTVVYWADSTRDGDLRPQLEALLRDIDSIDSAESTNISVSVRKATILILEVMSRKKNEEVSNELKKMLGVSILVSQPEDALLKYRLKQWISQLSPITPLDLIGKRGICISNLLTTSLKLDEKCEIQNLALSKWQANPCIRVGFEQEEEGSVQLLISKQPLDSGESNPLISQSIHNREIVAISVPISTIDPKEYHLLIKGNGIEKDVEIINFFVGKKNESKNDELPNPLEWLLNEVLQQNKDGVKELYPILALESAFHSDYEIIVDEIKNDPSIKLASYDFISLDIHEVKDTGEAEHQVLKIRNLLTRLMDPGFDEIKIVSPLGWMELFEKYKLSEKKYVFVLKGVAAVGKLYETEAKEVFSGLIEFLVKIASESHNKVFLFSLYGERMYEKLLPPKFLAPNITKKLDISPLDLNGSKALILSKTKGKTLTDLALQQIIYFAGGHWDFILKTCQRIQNHNSKITSAYSLQAILDDVIQEYGGIWFQSLKKSEQMILATLVNAELINKQTGVISRILFQDQRGEIQISHIEHLMQLVLVQGTLNLDEDAEHKGLLKNECQEVLISLLYKRVLAGFYSTCQKSNLVNQNGQTKDVIASNVSDCLMLKMGWIYYYIYYYFNDEAGRM